MERWRWWRPSWSSGHYEGLRRAYFAVALGVEYEDCPLCAPEVPMTDEKCVCADECSSEYCPAGLRVVPMVRAEDDDV